MPRRRLLLTVSSLVAVALAVTGCTIPTTKDGGGYGPSNQTARKAAPPPPVELRSGAKEELKSSDASWTPATYVTATGAKVVLDVSNTDPTQHNFTLGDLEISKNIPRHEHPDPLHGTQTGSLPVLLQIPPAGDAGLADGHLAVRRQPPASPHPRRLLTRREPSCPRSVPHAVPAGGLRGSPACSRC